MAYNKWTHQYSPLDRAISVADYIIEGDGHSTKEASEEFGLSTKTIQTDIRLLGTEAFYGRKSSDELKQKYFKVQKTLKEVMTRNSKRNSKKK